MTAQRVIPGLALLAILAACGEPAERAADAESAADTESVADTVAAVPGWVGRVAAIADAIEARPTAADSILAANDMTRAVFDSLIYEVAADPALSAAYEEARRR